jgi:predicted SnoaL-like aldol condensation-catalyzing enzyme
MLPSEVFMADRALKNAAVEFLKLVASGHIREAYDRHVGREFRHHNPFFRGDAASLRQAMEANAANNPDKVLEVKRVLQEGEQVAVLSHIRQRPGDRGAAVVHIFRFEAGRIVELWDIDQAVPEDAVNENGMF